MADSTENIQQKAYRLLKAIKARTENSHQPIFVAELAPELHMGEGELQSAFRYLKDKRWIDTFNIDYTARINAAGHELVEAVDRRSAASRTPPQNADSVSSAKVRRDTVMEWDVFISHASEDKEGFVRPLAKRLQEDELRVWFDEFTLTVGDSLRRSIDRGLVKSRYGMPAGPARRCGRFNSCANRARAELPTWSSVIWLSPQQMSPPLGRHIGLRPSCRRCSATICASTAPSSWLAGKMRASRRPHHRARRLTPALP
jgi:hypothetical protein